MKGRKNQIKPWDSWEKYSKSIETWDGRQVQIIHIPGSEPFRIFFFHGMGGNGGIWREQMRYFAEKGYTVIVMDMFGHGKSGTSCKVKDFHFKKMVQDVEVIFDEFRCLDEGVHNIVVGHSYG
eukprot:Sdes_comp10447_c0_seq1m2141